MEIDKETLDKILNSSVDFKRLYVEHSELKLKIGNMNKSKFLTAEEEVEKKRNQKQKLILKDKMEAILSQAR